MAATDRRETDSGIEVKPVYSADDAPASSSSRRASSRSPAGPYPDMYRGRPWTIRQYAGFALGGGDERALPLPARARADGALDRVRPADPARARLRRPARARRGRPHRRRDRLARGHGAPLRRHPARRGVDVDDDQRARRRCCSSSTSSSPRGRASPATELRGTVQNDILKEYVARGNYIFPPRPSMRLTTDLFAYCAERAAALEHDLDLRLPHPRGGLDRGAGDRVHARERDRVLPGGGRRRALAGRRSASGSRSSSTRTTTSSRRWRSSARRGGCGRGSCSERFGATNPKALALRFHAQTGGSTLTAQQPENNIVRVAIQALSAVCGGAQSLHTNSFDEALALPTRARGARSRCARSRCSGTRRGDRHGRPARRLLLHRGADGRARGPRAGADRPGRGARRRGRRDRGGLRPGRDRGGRLR